MRKDKLSSLAASIISELLSDPEVIEAISPLLTKIGSRIADATATRIKEMHSDALVKPVDGAIPVKELCKICKVSEPTFRKHFIDTGKLKLIPPPPKADRRQKYVSALAWEKISKAATIRVVKPKQVA